MLPKVKGYTDIYVILSLGDCGYTRTRGFTRTRPVPAVGYGSGKHVYGSDRVGKSRVRVYPNFTRNIIINEERSSEIRNAKS